MSINDDLNKTVSDTTESMSIFKLSEEELYDDVKPEKEDKKKPKKSKAKRNMIIMIIVTAIALVTAIVALFWGVNRENLYKEASDNYQMAAAKNADYEKKVKELENEITTLKAQIEEIQNAGGKSDGKYPAGSTLRITEEGNGQGVREKADKEAEIVYTDGHQFVVYWGETYKLVEDAIENNGTYWGKINGGYIRIAVDGEDWATIVE